MELYSRDAILMNLILMNLILQRHLFNVTSIMHSFILQCMGQVRECIQHLRKAKPMLILLNHITQIYLNRRLDLPSIDTVTSHMEAFTSTMVWRRTSVRLEQHRRLTPKNNRCPTYMSYSGNAWNSALRARSRMRRIFMSGNPAIWGDTCELKWVGKKHVYSCWY